MFRPETRQYGREALREWREQQRLWRAQNREHALDRATMSRRELRRARREGLLAPLSPEDRIRRIQRGAARYAFTVALLATINMMFSPRFPWFVFPTLFMGIGLLSRISSLWVDGIPIGRIFRRQPYVDRTATGASASGYAGQPQHAQVAPSASGPRAASADLALVTPEVLSGSHGHAVREAAEAKAVIVDVLAKLSPADRQMLPEIQPTVDALVLRVCSLARQVCLPDPLCDFGLPDTAGRLRLLNQPGRIPEFFPCTA